MKQNPSQANPIMVLLVALMVFTGCAKRERQVQTVDAKSSASAGQTRRININSASVEELQSLPGIGRVIAERIVEHRAQHGSFRRIEHLMLVRGISERKFLDIETLITVD